jgi:hypothetical protein
MSTLHLQQLNAMRKPSELRTYLEALQDIVYTRLYKSLSVLTSSHVEAAIVAHEDFYLTRPDYKENMVLTGISIGGDKDSIILEFTDTILGTESWKYAIQDLQVNELITFLETVEHINQ